MRDKRRVKILECQFADDDGRPSVAFDAHDPTMLVVTQRRSKAGASNWMGSALGKVLPAYAKYRADHHQR